MKNLSEFQDTKTKMSAKEIDKKYGYEIFSKYAFIYGDGFNIEIKENGFFSLKLERSEFYTKDLLQLETLLWDWAKFELGVSAENMEEDLHQRARDLMSSINKLRSRNVTLSLDEYYVEFMHENKDDDRKIKYLLDEFEGL